MLGPVRAGRAWAPLRPPRAHVVITCTYDVTVISIPDLAQLSEDPVQTVDYRGIHGVGKGDGRRRSPCKGVAQVWTSVPAGGAHGLQASPVPSTQAS
jgi:hypothetical protein